MGRFYSANTSYVLMSRGNCVKAISIFSSPFFYSWTQVIFSSVEVKLPLWIWSIVIFQKSSTPPLILVNFHFLSIFFQKSSNFTLNFYFFVFFVKRRPRFCDNSRGPNCDIIGHPVVFSTTLTTDLCHFVGDSARRPLSLEGTKI